MVYDPSIERDPPRDLLGWSGTVSMEKLIREQIENKVPERCQYQADSEPNQFILSLVKSEQAKDGIEDGIDLRALEKVVFGRHIIPLAQIIGSCVASGGMRAVFLRSIWEIYALGDWENPIGHESFDGQNNWLSFAPYSYRAGRRIGGLNGGDGSFCGAHIKGLMQYGFLPCDTPTLESDAWPEPQSSRTYRTWGNSNSLLDKFAPAGQQFDLVTSESVTDADFGKDRITTKFTPMMICSNWGFGPTSKKLSNGWTVYQRSGSWAHNMTIVGCVRIDGNWWVIVRNSWGSTAHKDGDCFVIPLELFGSWLRSAECATIGEIKQREPGDIPLFLAA